MILLLSTQLMLGSCKPRASGDDPLGQAQSGREGA